MIGIYCRTSKARNEKYTIENQKDEGVKFAKKNGLPFKIYVDDGISGTKDESTRIGLSELFDDLRNKQLTAVYATESARIARDTSTWNLFVGLCINFKVKYFQGGSELDLDNPSNQVFAELMSVFNAFYSQLTSYKVKQANAKKVSEGKTHGIKPYGYQRNEQNNYVIFEQEAIHVRKIFELSLGGLGAYSIANYLNKEGVPTKFKGNFLGSIKRKDPDTKKIKEFKKENVKWRGNVISDMLRNPIYKGERVWNMFETVPNMENGRSKKIKRLVETIITKDHVPPIIDEDTWEKVQHNLQINKKNVGPKDYYHYLLNGIVICAKCGKEYRGKKRPKGNDMAYKCTNKQYPNPKCDNRGINIPKLESFIIRFLLYNKETFNLLRSLPNKPTETQILIESAEEKNKEIADLTKKIKNFVLLLPELDSKDIPKEFSNKLTELQQARNRISNELKSLEKRISSEESGLSEQKLQKAQILINGIRTKLNTLENFELIRKIIQSIIESIVVEYNSETQAYFLKINLIGKEEALFVVHNRFKEVWTFTDEKGNEDFTEENKPLWMNSISFSYVKSGEKFYRYGFLIKKKDYFYFD